MTEDEKSILRETIFIKIKGLEEELDQMKDAIQPISPDDSIGRLSRMDAINNQAVVKAAYKDKQTLIARLKHSLTLINEVNYGKCNKCNEEIPFARLKSIPYANFCMDCTNR